MTSALATGFTHQAITLQPLSLTATGLASRFISMEGNANRIGEKYHAMMSLRILPGPPGGIRYDPTAARAMFAADTALKNIRAGIANGTLVESRQSLEKAAKLTSYVRMGEATHDVHIEGPVRPVFGDVHISAEGVYGYFRATEPRIRALTDSVKILGRSDALGLGHTLSSGAWIAVGVAGAAATVGAVLLAIKIKDYLSDD